MGLQSLQEREEKFPICHLGFTHPIFSVTKAEQAPNYNQEQLKKNKKPIKTHNFFFKKKKFQERERGYQLFGLESRGKNQLVKTRAYHVFHFVGFFGFEVCSKN